MNEFRSQIFGGRAEREKTLLGAKKPRGARAEAGLESVTVPRSEIRTNNTRDGDRHRLTGERAVVTHEGRSHDVELVNLSGGGAMVSGFKPLLWDMVELHLAEDASLACTVRWIKGKRVGLEFASETRVECSPQELESLLRDIVGRSFPEVAVDIVVPVQAAPAAQSAKQAVEDESRRAERVPLIWSAQIHYDFTSSPARLRNISATGALIECDFALPVGAEPLLDLGESGQLFATVSWRRGEQIGLRFKSPFDLASLSRSKPAMAPIWRAPSSAEAAVSAEEEATDWDNLSASELRERLEGFLKR